MSTCGETRSEWDDTEVTDADVVTTKMSFTAAFLVGYNDFDATRVDDVSYWAYVEGCVYTNIRVAIAVGFSMVIFLLLDTTYTLDYGGKYTRRHDVRAVPVERRHEVAAMLHRGDPATEYEHLAREYRFRKGMNQILRKLCGIPDFRGKVLCGVGERKRP